MADVAGVLLEQMEQDPLEGRRIVAVPPVARLAYVGKVVGLDDGPGTHRLGAKARDQLRERLVGGYVPAAVPAVGKRVADIAPSKPHSSHRSST